MNKKEIEIAERSFNIIEKCKDDLLKLCDGQSVSLAISVLLTSADFLKESANEIEERHYEQKRSFRFTLGSIRGNLKIKGGVLFRFSDCTGIKTIFDKN